jgi:hypothetical protein
MAVFASSSIVEPPLSMPPSFTYRNNDERQSLEMQWFDTSLRKTLFLWRSALFWNGEMPACSILEKTAYFSRNGTYIQFITTVICQLSAYKA